MNYLFQPQRYNFISTIMNKVLSNASSASCWIVKLDLPILCLSLFRTYWHVVVWQLPYCWMATATQLDGDRHTVGWRPPHFVVNLSETKNASDHNYYPSVLKKIKSYFSFRLSRISMLRPSFFIFPLYWCQHQLAVEVWVLVQNCCVPR